eukprot:286005-Amphidinium_carterae.1
MDCAPIHVAKSFRKRASEEFSHIKFVFVEAGITGFSQPAELPILKVFKSEAKSLACAAYARDVLNITDAFCLVKPKAAQLRASLVPIMNNATQHVENTSTYPNAWRYVRQYDTASLEQSALHCVDVLHSEGKLFQSLQKDAVGQTVVEECNGLPEEAEDMPEVEWAEPPIVAACPAEKLGANVSTKSKRMNFFLAMR